MTTYAKWSLVWQVLVFLFAIVIVVSSVRADHPFAAKPYWPTQSIGRSSLVLSKIAFAFTAALGVPVLAQVLMVLILRLPISPAASGIVNSAYWLASAIAGALLLTSLVTRRKSIVFAVAGLLLARLLAATSLRSKNPLEILTLAREAPAVHWLLIPAVLAVFAWMYRRDSLSATFKRAVAATVLLVASLLWTPADLVLVIRRPMVAALLDSTTTPAKLELREASYSPGIMRLVLAVPASIEGRRILLARARIVLYFRDGTSETTNILTPDEPQFRSNTSDSSVPTSLPIDTQFLTLQTFTGWTGNGPVLKSPVRVEIDALLEEQTYKVRLTTPLTAGSGVTIASSRYRVGRVDLNDVRPIVTVEQFEFASPPLIVDVVRRPEFSGMSRNSSSVRPSGSARDATELWNSEAVLGIAFEGQASRVNYAKFTPSEGLGQLILPTGGLRRRLHRLPINLDRGLAALNLVIGEWAFHSVAPAHAEFIVRTP